MFADTCSPSRAARRHGRLPWLAVVGVVLALAPVTRSHAAVTLTTLLDFDAVEGPAGSNPKGGLLRARGGSFYGTTTTDNKAGFGTVFRLGQGNVLTTVYRFDGTDGSGPTGTLVQGTDGNFYGTTRVGGPQGYGTVFRLTPGGSLTTLHAFDNDDDGGGPAGIVQGADGAFYGTTGGGGTRGYGTVFRVTADGVLATLYNFTGDTDGSSPQAAPVQGSDGNFYGTTASGGSVNDGTVFKITPAGVLTTLHVFGGADGRLPLAGLVQGADGAFYGTTVSGGNAYGEGTVFRVTAAGAFSTVYRFENTADDLMEGAGPAASLIQGTDGNFYGTTVGGPAPAGTESGSGIYGAGTVFRLTPSGVLTTLRTFNGLDASAPMAALVQGSDGTLYGTAYGRIAQGGGHLSGGSVFQLTMEDSPAVPAVTAVVTVRDAYSDAASSDGSSISGEVLLSLSSAPTGTIKVVYTLGGDAQAGVDYGTLARKVKFKRGETGKVITIDPIYTGGSGSEKKLKLKLAGGNGYTVETTAALKVRLHLYP